MKKIIITILTIIVMFGMTANVYATETHFDNVKAIKITKATKTIEKRGFTNISFDGTQIGTQNGYACYADSIVFNEETQTYSGEEIQGTPYKELYIANGTDEADYELVVDFNIGHKMYKSYKKQIKKIKKIQKNKKNKKSHK